MSVSDWNSTVHVAGHQPQLDDPLSYSLPQRPCTSMSEGVTSLTTFSMHSGNTKSTPSTAVDLSMPRGALQRVKHIRATHKGPPAGFLTMMGSPQVAEGEDSPLASRKRHHVLESADAASLRRLQYFQWASSFDTEKQLFQSPAIWAEIVLVQAIEATKHAPLPDPLRTAACCLVLDRLIPGMGLYSKVLNIIRNEILNAVYTTHHVDLSKCTDGTTRKAVENKTSSGRTIQSAGHTGKGTASTPSGAVQEVDKVPTYVDMPLYATAYKRSMHQLELQSHQVEALQFQHESKQLVMIRGQMASFRRTLMYCVFRAWRNMKASSGKSALGVWGRFAGSSSNSQIMDRYFDKWRGYLRLKPQLMAKKKEEAAYAMKQFVSAAQLRKDSSSDAAPLPIDDDEVQGKVRALGGLDDFGDMANASPHGSFARHGTGRPSSIRKGSVKEDNTFVKAQNVPPIELLRSWAHLALKKQNVDHTIPFENFRSSVADGKVFIAVLNVVAPELGCDYALQMDSVKARVELVVQLTQSLGLPDNFITPNEIIRGDIACVALGGWMFDLWYRNSREEISVMEFTMDTRSLLCMFAKHLGIGRSHQEAFEIVAYRIRTYVSSVLLEKVRELDTSSVSEADLFAYCEVLPAFFGDFQVDTHSESAMCTGMLRQNYSDLKKIFAFYNGLTPQAEFITMSDFWKLIDDCALTKLPGLGKTVIMNLIATVMNRNEAEGNQVNPRLYVELLVRFACSHAVALGMVLESGVVANVIDDLLQKHIIQRAMSNDKDEFKKIVSGHRVREALSSVAKPLAKLFKQYASVSTSGEATITSAKFVAMIGDLGLLDKAMKKEDVASIFADIQDDFASGAGTLMDASEFQEALVAVAVYKYPSPMLPVHKRLNTFLTQQLIPAATKILKR